MIYTAFVCQDCGKTIRQRVGPGKKYCNECLRIRERAHDALERERWRKKNGKKSREESIDIAENIIRDYFSIYGKKNIFSTADISWWAHEQNKAPEDWDETLCRQYLALAMRHRFPEYDKVGSKTYAIAKTCSAMS